MLRLRHPVSLVIISFLVLLGVLRSYSPPAPVDAGAPDVVFSADRAEAILQDLLREKQPHAVGSAANAVVRDRVMGYFRAAGYEPELQTIFHCNPIFGACAPVQNIIATKPGAAGGQAVLVTAHYDSVWAGPGAADDGAAVAAILEIARMAADFPPFRNDVVFFIADGEEAGLIGADAFAEHHPLFQDVKAVINLEARGVTGPSAMFETGTGNRSVIRMLSKNVDRPVGTSLVYEMYRRMPNDTDYTVYKRRGVMGLNFAFADGVALYHSVLDDVDHLDLGSLQHHGDNAWGMLKALGERDLNTIFHREDAGYIDLFGTRLIHYPVSIAGGLALFFGVWVMLAIGLAFRKDFRYRQLRWGLLAIPLMLVALVVGGYLLSWPLGRWPEMHPLAHPAPWVGRLTLFLMLVLACYAFLKVFTGRVSACAWMILAWAVLFVAGLVLASRMPAAVHLAVLPLFMFALGSVIDLFRKKSPAPLLMASVLGFAAAAFISLYHFMMLGVVLNFDRAHFLLLPLWLMALTAMPMLLAFVKNRDLTWQPARWLLVAVLSGCLVHLLLPGFTAERPRDMTLMYAEVEGAALGHIVLESLNRQPDRGYARSHDFEVQELDNGHLGTVQRPARPVAALGLPGVTPSAQRITATEEGWLRKLQLDLPEDTRFVELTLPEAAALRKAWVNGVPAIDTSIETKHGPRRPTLRLYYPGDGPVAVELLTESGGSLSAAAVTWHDLPGLLTAPFMGNWPDDAQPNRFGPRAEKIQQLELVAEEEPKAQERKQDIL
jgi:hypothetical protein